MSKHQPDDLEQAREFLTEVAHRLEVDPDIVLGTMPHLLGMTKHVAHDAVRPAAPLAAFLVGLAAGRDADAAGVLAQIEKVEATVKEFADGQN